MNTSNRSSDQPRTEAIIALTICLFPAVACASTSGVLVTITSNPPIMIVVFSRFGE
jgi:hypothetical protein